MRVSPATSQPCPSNGLFLFIYLYFFPPIWRQEGGIKGRQKKKKGKEENRGQRAAVAFQASSASSSPLSLWVFSRRTRSGRRFPLVGQAPRHGPPGPAIQGQRVPQDPRAPPTAGGGLPGGGPPRGIAALPALDLATLALALPWLVLFSCLLFCLSPPLRRLEGEGPESLQECSCFPWFVFFFFSFSLSA